MKVKSGIRSVFRSKKRDKSKLFTIGVDDRSLDAIKTYNCLINYRFGITPVHLYRGKPSKDISENTSDGKPTEIPEGIAKAIEAERT